METVVVELYRDHKGMIFVIIPTLEFPLVFP